MPLRDTDLISVVMADKRLMVDKLNAYANQVTDPGLRSLIQDAANVQNRHVQMLNQTQSRIGIQPGQINPGQATFAGAQAGQTATGFRSY